MAVHACNFVLSRVANRYGILRSPSPRPRICVKYWKLPMTDTENAHFPRVTQHAIIGNFP